MKRTFCKVISVFMLITMLFSTGVAGVTSLAASESDYVATFSIKTDKTSLSKGEDVVVSVNLKTNYYIYAMEIPVIYDGDALEVQNTSPSSNKSFLTFKGKLASAYVTNGNWKSPSNFYTHRNSNTEYWSQKKVMDRYKIAFASWSSNTELNDGKAVKLSSEETIVSFVLKAKKDIKNISGLIFLSDDFKKTPEFSGGRWFCGRSEKEKINSDKYVATGQTLKYVGSAPSGIPDSGSDEGGNNVGGNNGGGYVDDSIVAINYKGTVCLADNLSSSILKDYKLTWSSSDESVRVVDEKTGEIYGEKVGTAIVTAKSKDGKFVKDFEVTVSYSFFQWIIIIVLFGWIWYI